MITIHTMERKIGMGWRAAVTHCAQGHEYSPENTLWTTEGARSCRECRRARHRERYRTDPAYREAQRQSHRAWREAR